MQELNWSKVYSEFCSYVCCEKALIMMGSQERENVKLFFPFLFDGGKGVAFLSHIALTYIVIGSNSALQTVHA